VSGLRERGELARGPTELWRQVWNLPEWASEKPASSKLAAMRGTMATDFTALAKSCRTKPPRVVIVLGSGMGPVAQRVRRSIAFRSRRCPACQVLRFTATKDG